MFWFDEMLRDSSRTCFKQKKSNGQGIHFNMFRRLKATAFAANLRPEMIRLL